MKTRYQLLVLSVLSALSPAASAVNGIDGAPVDTSQWKCESCTFEQGLSGTMDVGAGSVSEKSAKFGEYNGLNKKGGFLLGDGAVRYRGAQGDYWNLDASNLGVDARALDAEGGRQGSYKLRLKYDELPHAIANGVNTPFSGGASLTLPTGFQAGTTPAMPLGNLQQVDLSTQRKRLGVGASWTAVTDREYALNVRHETKEGTKRSAGAFFVNAAQLAEPVDYVTDQVDASVTYAGAKLQAKFSYYGSTFRNGNSALTWRNPYAPIIAGDNFGQLALPPGNEFHQALASLGYQLSASTRASADIAVGRMTQNENFLAPTLNATAPGLLQALPGSSLNGSAATFDANLKLSSAVTEQLRLNAAYMHNNRDNQTPQTSYPVVTTDMFAGTARTNLPYSFTQNKMKLSGDYKASASTRMSLGFDNDALKRTYQEVDRMRENTVWGKVSSRLDKVELTLKYSYASRTNSGYQAVPGITPPENPLLRKYSMADRTRDSVGLRADIAAAENVSIGLGVDVSKDDYTASSIGLKSGRDLSLNADVSLILTPETNMHVFGGRQEIKSEQAGSQAFSTADWWGRNDDRIDLVGLGVKHAAIKDTLDLGADYIWSHARGEISMITAAPSPGFPSLTTRLYSLKFYANYKLNDKTSLVGSYWFERMDSKNWMLDGVGPSTIPNVLTFGEQAPHYRVHVLRLALRYKF